MAKNCSLSREYIVEPQLAAV